MDYNSFLTAVIDSGIEAAKADYTRPDQKDKLEGSLAGFEACKGRTPSELKSILYECEVESKKLLHSTGAKNWMKRCFALEVEWVCNVVSAMLMNEGLPTIITPTARGILAAQKILGVAYKVDKPLVM